MPKVLLVVPCYNEARRLPVDTFFKFAIEHPDYFVLFVNDGSTDSTLEVLEKLMERCPDAFEILDLPRNSGKAEAVRQGFLKGFERNPDYIAYWDADLATPLDVLPSFVEVFEHRPRLDIVLGSRVQLLGRQIDRSLFRHYLGRVFATTVSLLLKLNVYDTQCGAKMFRTTPQIRGVFEEPFISRWIFDVEILVRYLKELDPILKLPDVAYEFTLPVWTDVYGSKVSPGDFLTALGDLLKIRSRYR